MIANPAALYKSMVAKAKIRYERATALAVARELCAALKPVTDRLLVAGSLRRRKGTVGDVEILFVPRFEDRPDPGDLFGKPAHMNLAALTLEEWLATGRLSKRLNANGGSMWGEQNRLAVHVVSGIPVDFFQARAANWWNLVVCRTGSAESNIRICSAALRRGWKWDPYGAGFYDRLTGDLVCRTSSEADVFESLGLRCVEPWER